MLNNGTPIWDPHYITRNWGRGHREIEHWELVIPTKYGEASFGRRYVGVLVYPNGVLTIDDKEIQCASVEEAKEIGMATYLLTKEGG